MATSVSNTTNSAGQSAFDFAGSIVSNPLSKGLLGPSIFAAACMMVMVLYGAGKTVDLVTRSSGPRFGNKRLAPGEVSEGAQAVIGIATKMLGGAASFAVGPYADLFSSMERGLEDLAKNPIAYGDFLNNFVTANQEGITELLSQSQKVEASVTAPNGQPASTPQQQQ